MSDNVYQSAYQVQKETKKLELLTTLGDGFDVALAGRQTYTSEWDNGLKRSVYRVNDEYDLSIDLSENDGKRIGRVTVNLPGLEVELGCGWFSVKTDYGWQTYVEYDAPKTWKANVLKEGGDD